MFCMHFCVGLTSWGHLYAFLQGGHSLVLPWGSFVYIFTWSSLPWEALVCIFMGKPLPWASPYMISRPFRHSRVPESRSAGVPESRRPGCPKAWRPGSSEARKPGGPEARKPEGSESCRFRYLNLESWTVEVLESKGILGVLESWSPGVPKPRRPRGPESRSPEVLEPRSPGVLESRSPGVPESSESFSPGVLEAGVVEFRSPQPMRHQQ